MPEDLIFEWGGQILRAEPSLRAWAANHYHFVISAAFIQALVAQAKDSPTSGTTLQACTTERKSGLRAGPAGTGASPFGGRLMCLGVGPTGATGVTVAMWCWSATRRGATSLRCRGASTFGAGGASMGKGPTGMGGGGTSGRSWCRRGRRPKRSMGAWSTWSSRGSGRWWRMAGVGGMGTSGLRTPRGRRRGLPRRGRVGEEGWIELRLKLLADAGLIGLPNAGKSSLLGRLTRAAPKVADYPVHDALAGAGDDRERRAAGRRRRHPGPDRRRGRGRRARPRVPRPRRALRDARPPGRPGAAGGRAGGQLRGRARGAGLLWRGARVGCRS